MKWMARGLAFAVAAAAWPSMAQADTVIVYTNPMTLERKVVVNDAPGPDRAFHCFLPPSNIGCQPIALRRGR
jgi:hypothetical protein